jgi:hypothetical protein
VDSVQPQDQPWQWEMPPNLSLENFHPEKKPTKMLMELFPEPLQGKVG